jgi:hypothetical protein
MKKTHVLLFISVFTISSCGSLLDISGRGAKTKCFYLDCCTMKIIYDCGDKGIFKVNVCESSDKGKTYTKVLLSKDLPGFPNEWTIPLERDSLKDKYMVVELHLTDTHYRESYYIDIKPGDLATTKKIFARYFSH